MPASDRETFITATRDFAAALRALGITRIHLWTGEPDRLPIIVQRGAVEAECLSHRADPTTNLADAWDALARQRADQTLLETLY